MLRWFPGKNIVKCPGCGLVFYEGVAPPGNLYNDEYFSGGEYLDYCGDKKIIQRNFRRHIKVLHRLVPSGRLLELGCAYGFFLELAREHWEVKGIDVTAAGVRHARDVVGVNALQKDFLTLSDEPESWDVICLWDTIEHLPDPILTLRKAATWLKPGGVLLLTTGDIESRLARLRGERWRQIHPPTHLYYFSSATLGKALVQAGLQVESISYVGYSRGFRAMIYGLFALPNKKSRWLYQLLTLGGRLDFPIYLNLYDILLVIAKKPAAKSVGQPKPRQEAR
jgi:SAM-dependent methyltransferase